MISIIFMEKNMSQLAMQPAAIVKVASDNQPYKIHQLPPLKYDYAALEPTIDVRTMILHHDNHHASYVKKA